MQGAKVLWSSVDEMRRVRCRMAIAFLLLGLLALFGAGAVAYQMLVGVRAPLDEARRAEIKVLHTAEIARHGTAIGAELYRHAISPLAPGESANLRARAEEIAEHMQRLGPLIDAGEEDSYQRAQALFKSFHAVTAQALAATERGQQDAVVELLQDQMLPVLAEAREIADEMIESNQAAAAAYLHEGNERMRNVLWVVLVAAFLFILLIAGAGCYSFRIVRRQQERITDQMSRLEQAVADLDAFAGRVAHDIRAPLGPVLLAAEQLQRSRDPQVVERMADRILRSARSANELIESLLAFSRAGQATPGGQCDTAVAVERALDETRDAASEANVDLKVEPASHRVAIEEPLLSQLLVNLIGNAIRYMPEERRERRVRVSARRRGAMVRLEVADTGRGIPSGERDRVFQPFYRDTLAHPGVRGTGLGLATVRRIVEAHGGSVGISDAPEGGACVWFTVPTVPSAVTAPVEVDAPEQSLEQPGQLL